MVESKAISARVLIRGVAAAWRRQYPRDFERIHERLCAIDVETATAADVEAIIGNRSWTIVPRCHGCGLGAELVVEVGEEPDYESSTATLCESCLRDALATLEALRASEGAQRG
jgi:hypothetical protein